MPRSNQADRPCGEARGSGHRHRGEGTEAWDNGDANKARKALEVARADVVEALRLARYFVRQADWHQERFPEAKPRDVEGLVKLVDRATIKAHDWSLTPGRYVGVALEEPDEPRDRRPLAAPPVRFRRRAVVESPSAIGAIPEAFFALLARSKSKGEPA
jgi:hypothetical protein